MHRILGKGKRRRRQFAAPFVMTAALLPGCAAQGGGGTGAPAPAPTGTVQSKDQAASPAQPKPHPRPAADESGATTDKRPNPAALNPPNPHHQLPTAAPPGHRGSMVILNPPSHRATNGTHAGPKTGPKLHPPPKSGHVFVKADGTCWWRAPAAHCPPGAMCNPPPPMRVLCKNGKATMKPTKGSGHNK